MYTEASNGLIGKMAKEVLIPEPNACITPTDSRSEDSPPKNHQPPPLEVVFYPNEATQKSQEEDVAQHGSENDKNQVATPQHPSESRSVATGQLEKDQPILMNLSTEKVNEIVLQVFSEAFNDQQENPFNESSNKDENNEKDPVKEIIDENNLSPRKSPERPVQELTPHPVRTQPKRSVKPPTKYQP